MFPFRRSVIATHSPQALGVGYCAIAQAGAGNAAWPAANDALFIPLVLDRPVTVSRMFAANGNVAGNAIDLGIYTADGALIVSSGSAAQSGTITLQFLDVTDTYLSPGQYYMAAAANGTTATMRRFSTSIIIQQMLGVLKATSSFPLPTSVTFATVTATYVPIIGVEIAGWTLI